MTAKESRGDAHRVNCHTTTQDLDQRNHTNIEQPGQFHTSLTSPWPSKPALEIDFDRPQQPRKPAVCRNIFSATESCNGISVNKECRRDRVYEDTSDYSDSPPVETQDFRHLSQLHANESLASDTYDGSSACINEHNTDSDDIGSFGNSKLPTDMSNVNYEHKSRNYMPNVPKALENPVLKRQKYNLDTAAEQNTTGKVEDLDTHCNMKGDIHKKFDSSQCLLSQDTPVHSKKSKSKPYSSVKVAQGRWEHADNSELKSVNSDNKYFSEIRKDEGLGLAEQEQLIVFPATVPESKVKPCKLKEEKGKKGQWSVNLRSDHDPTLCEVIDTDQPCDLMETAFEKESPFSDLCLHKDLNNKELNSRKQKPNSNRAETVTYPHCISESSKYDKEKNAPAKCLDESPIRPMEKPLYPVLNMACHTAKR